MPRKAKAVEERFWSKVDKNGPLPDQSNPHYAGLGRCWTWTDSGGGQGYGNLFINKKNVAAHRLSFMIASGTIPALYVCHKCDNRSCVNPDHLFLQTHSGNMEDMLKKGRQAAGDRNGSRKYPERRPRGDTHIARLHPEIMARGEGHVRCKITDANVAQLRADYATGQWTKTALAKKYGISATQVYMITTNRSRIDKPASKV